MKKLTLSQIKAINQQTGHHFFDRKTLRFFGETMRNYKAGAIREDGLQLLYRVGGKAGSKTFLFNSKDGSIKRID